MTGWYIRSWSGALGDLAKLITMKARRFSLMFRVCDLEDIVKSCNCVCVAVENCKMELGDWYQHIFK
jgi:hypothetical protein